MNKAEMMHRFEDDMGSTAAAKRAMSARLEAQTMAFLSAGGRITIAENRPIAEIKLQYNNKPVSPEHQAKAGAHLKHSQLNRDLAIEGGHPKYMGAIICRKCTVSYERWTKTKQCTTCWPRDPSINPKQDAMRARQAAINRGDEVYEGRPCTVCKTVRRLIDNGSCIECHGPERYRLRGDA